MLLRSLRIAVAVLTVAMAVGSFAQGKAELSVGYSYLSQNTKVSFDSPKGFINSFLGGVNGGDVGLAFNLNKTLGLKVDVAGYTQSPDFSSNVFTATAGPIIKKHSGVFNPFAQALFGVAHKSVSGLSLDKGQWAFAGVAGGGIDLKMSEHVTLRPAEVDYVLTTLPSAMTGNGFDIGHRQNNFRYVGGVVFLF